MSLPRWEKLGLLFDPRTGPRHPKLLSHAANPLPVLIDGDTYRVFYSARDAQNRSSVGAVDIDIAARRIVKTHEGPVFEHGPEGSFHADGVSVGNCYRASDGARYILFMAWEIPADAHWRGTVGRLRLTEDLGLKLAESEPYIGRSEVDPVSLSYPWVQQMADGTYQMWYGSTVAWDAGNGEMRHVFNHATSPDGLAWTLTGQGVPDIIGVAQAFSRPTVAAHPDGGLEMWYSFRGAPGRTYRIGYARAENGVDWALHPESAGIDVGPEPWDSDMIEYPFVFDHKGARYMMYNGNGYGKTGIGLAVLRDRM